ncbi:hypothetical protein Kazakh3190_15290 [Helicobacter pylori]
MSEKKLYFTSHLEANQLVNLTCLASKSASNLGYQSHLLQNRISEALASIQAVLY